MTRRGRFSHRLLRIAQPTSCDFGDDDIAVVLSLDGATTVTSAQDSATLDHGDAALDQPDDDDRLSDIAGN